MSTRTLNHYEIVSQMPADTVVTFHGVTWEDYEQLLGQVGGASGLRISYDDGTLQVITLSSEHENYVRFIESLMTVIRLKLRINIRSFGSATMKQLKRRKANEADACFYIQTASVIGNKIQINFANDPPPDVAVEVDIHHESGSKLPIYVALGVPEVWLFDGKRLSIHLLHGNDYLEAPQSQALPILTAQALSDFLIRLPKDGELQTLLAFDEWLQSLQQ